MKHRELWWMPLLLLPLLAGAALYGVLAGAALGRGYPLALFVLAAAVVTACALRARSAARREAEARNILAWLGKNNVDDYYQNGELSPEVPGAVGEAIRHLTKVIGTQYSAQILEKQVAYSALQSQINPHFLYNTLEAIRSQALLCGQADIAQMTERLSRFFRYCISNMGDYVTIQDEADNLQDYFFIQKYRFEDRFAMEVRLKPDGCADSLIPKMTLQPVVENAIYHGLEQKAGKGCVSVSAFSTRDRVYITVSDDGVGMEEEQVIKLNERLRNPLEAEEMRRNASSRRGGIALANVNSRLKLHFGPEYGLRVCSTPGKGTDVEIVVPLVEGAARMGYLGR